MVVKKCVRCCGRSFVKARRVLRRVVGDADFEATVPAVKCASCGETYVDAQHGVLFERARALAESGVVHGEALKAMRRFLGLRAKDLAPLLGVAEGTLSRWETGERPADRAATALVGQLVLDACSGVTSTMERLRRASSHRGARTRKLDLAAEARHASRRAKGAA